MIFSGHEFPAMRAALRGVAFNKSLPRGGRGGAPLIAQRAARGGAAVTGGGPWGSMGGPIQEAARVPFDLSQGRNDS